jgi:hypothetical protein
MKTVYGVTAKEKSTAKVSELLQEAGFDPDLVNNQKH